MIKASKSIIVSSVSVSFIRSVVDATLTPYLLEVFCQKAETKSLEILQLVPNNDNFLQKISHVMPSIR